MMPKGSYNSVMKSYACCVLHSNLKMQLLILGQQFQLTSITQKLPLRIMRCVTREHLLVAQTSDTLLMQQVWFPKFPPHHICCSVIRVFLCPMPVLCHIPEVLAIPLGFAAWQSYSWPSSHRRMLPVVKKKMRAALAPLPSPSSPILFSLSSLPFPPNSFGSISGST